MTDLEQIAEKYGYEAISCSSCRGQGETSGERCVNCQGSGRLWQGPAGSGTLSDDGLRRLAGK